MNQRKNFWMETFFPFMGLVVPAAILAYALVGML